MPSFIDLSGLRFGRWLVKSYGQKSFWLCLCDCGTKRLVDGWALRAGVSVSCGCYKSEVSRKRATKHGLHKTAEYTCYYGILTRVNDINDSRYGGRGITICDRWHYGDGNKSGFECFYEDMGPRPNSDYSIERKNNDGNYEPDNCCWATIEQQNKNRRISHEKSVAKGTGTLKLRIGIHGLSKEQRRINALKGGQAAAAKWRAVRAVEI